MAGRKLRARAVRRRLGREEERLADERERLAASEPGGAPERPLDVDSPPQVDVIAERTRCPRCSESMRLDRHDAAVVDGARLRVAHVVCTVCGHARRLYFRLAAAQLH